MDVVDEAGLDPRSDDDGIFEDAREDDNVSNVSSVSGDSEHAPDDPLDTYASRAAFGLPVYDGERLYTDLERDNFHPDNVTPNRPCTAFFRPSTYLEAKDVFDALERDGFPPASIRCLQRRPSGEIFVTFRTPEMRNDFLRRSSFIVRRGRYATNTDDSTVLYLTVYDAPCEMPDSVIIARLLNYCSVVGQRRGRHHSQPTVFNGLRHYRVQLKKDGVSVPSFLRFGKFLLRFSHSGQTQTCRKCNRSGHLAAACDNTLCFNCDQLGHVARECPNPMLCCLCKSSSHLARACPAAWNNTVVRSNSAVADPTSSGEQDHPRVEVSQSQSASASADQNSQPQSASASADQNSQPPSNISTPSTAPSVSRLNDPPGSAATPPSDRSGCLDSQGLIKPTSATNVNETPSSGSSPDNPSGPSDSGDSPEDSRDFSLTLAPFLSRVIEASESLFPSGSSSSSASSPTSESSSSSAPPSGSRAAPSSSAIPRPQRGSSFRRKPASVVVSDAAAPRRPTKPTPVRTGRSSQKPSVSTAQSDESAEPMDSSENRKRKGVKATSDGADRYGKQAPT